MDGRKGWIFQTDSALLPLTLDLRLFLGRLDFPWTNYLCILATTLSQGLHKALWDCYKQVEGFLAELGALPSHKKARKDNYLLHLHLPLVQNYAVPSSVQQLLSKVFWDLKPFLGPVLSPT